MAVGRSLAGRAAARGAAFCFVIAGDKIIAVSAQDDYPPLPNPAPPQPVSWLPELQTTFQELTKESDRGIVLIGGAYLDSCLRRLILWFLMSCPEYLPTFFEHLRSAGEFAGRIEIAHQLGLITKEMQWLLHKIRKIRIIFAHEVVGCQFTERPHLDYLREIHAALAGQEIYESHAKFIRLQNSTLNEQSVIFRAAVWLLGDMFYDLLFLRRIEHGRRRATSPEKRAEIDLAAKEMIDIFRVNYGIGIRPPTKPPA